MEHKIRYLKCEKLKMKQRNQRDANLTTGTSFRQIEVTCRPFLKKIEPYATSCQIEKCVNTHLKKKNSNITKFDEINC